MLKQRILTAIVLIPLVFAALWYLPNAVVAAIVGGLMLACAWEWAGFMSLSGSARAMYVALTALLVAFAHPALGGAQLLLPLLAAGLLWWLLATVWVLNYPAGFAQIKSRVWLYGVLGWAAILPCYAAIWHLHGLEHGRELIFLLLFLVWATDTGGYFAGKRFGRHKLAPLVSPNKTWEGLVGGVVLAMALAAAAGYWVFEPPRVLAFTALGLGVALVSVIGDLSVSMFKRQCGVKDTGRLFPGHGGALDRLDSLLSAAPVMLVAYVYLVAV
ncbi:phosphatidate cytidylyltransferase [Oceanococcus atlanticus]|uniref:Phosphatidate cytidylyltransferase n=1 Tax=Oceanococcus atlanticus TaxID=1317117 RepID=A0A1Y1SEB4_9GAMM|nr:phosphatidate cytidylyltransferase [Oceanococcus atlanticus]ORE87034.1 phosphatidate cytidylyltransferase [Oceanococcus atlanticus]RZO86787.1 MAG: phosphatidate cytidylyltransferase [Oceanococcus sp.]